MLAYRYRVRDPLGHIHEGRLQAATVDDATQMLRRDGFHVLEMNEDNGRGGGLFARPVGKRDLIYITTQLAIMVDTGITLSAALGGIVQQEKNPSLRHILEELKESVEGGEDFSSALARHPKIFDKNYVSLVRASEATGKLGEMLNRIAEYLRKEVETKGRVRSAMAYPGVMLVVAVGVTIFLLTYVLPKFAPLFAARGNSLPKATKIMMTISNAMIHYWYAWLAVLVVAVGSILYALRTEWGRQTWDWAKINMPILGQMFRKVAISRSLRTLGTMIASGVPMIESLRLTAEVSGNYYYRKLWMDVLHKVTGGTRIHETLANNSLFPPVLVQMIASGEESGKLDDVLARVSSYYDQEVETALKMATSVIEPIMITVMGVIVGGIAMALLLPIFSLSKPA